MMLQTYLCVFLVASSPPATESGVAKESEIQAQSIEAEQGKSRDLRFAHHC